MSRRFRYYALPAGALDAETDPMVFRLEVGQDYDLFQSVQDGRWVQDNAAYELVHTSGEAEECEAEEAHRRLADLFGPEQADRLVPVRQP